MDKLRLNSFLVGFILVISAQLVLVFLFPEKIYRLMTVIKVESFLLGYELFLVPVLLLISGWYFFKNLPYLKNLVLKDKFFKIILLLLLVLFIFLLFQDINIVRMDKGLSALRAINDSISLTSTGNGNLFKQRASGFFLVMHFVNMLIPQNFETLAFVSTLLVILQFAAFYFILKLILKDSRIVFLTSLIFFLHPNNFLIARAPDYFFSGQVLGTLSLLALLLFVKYKDNKSLFLSLALLVLAMLFRIEMVIWFFVYFVILFFLTKEEEFLKIRNFLYIFLLLISPITLRVIVSFISSPFSLNSYVDPAESNAIIGAASYAGGLIAYYKKFIIEHFFRNIKYLFTAVPLSVALLAGLIFYRNKNIKIYIFYFFTYLAAITIFQYNEFIWAPQYLSYLVLPLVILTGIIFDSLVQKKERYFYFTCLAGLIIIGLNIYFYKPGYVWTDESTVVENSVYQTIKQSKEKIPPGSLIITNNKNSALKGFFGINNKKIKIITADRNLIEQVNSNKDTYDNIFLNHGSFSCSDAYEHLSVFNETDFLQLIKNNFTYEVIYEKSKGDIIKSEPRVYSTGENYDCPVFLYKIIFNKK